jgi:hypothetical protein
MTGLMEGRFTGRVAVVSGAANGIGRASALRLAREGADLVVVDREGDTLQGVAREIEAAGRQVLPSARKRRAIASPIPRGRAGHEHPAPGQPHAPASARNIGRSASATSSPRASQTPEWPRMYLISSSRSVMREGRPMICGCMARQKYRSSR